MTGLESREKVNQIKSCSILSSVPWAVVSVCVLGSMAPPEHKGSDSISDGCGPPEARRWNCLWSPGVRVGPTFTS